MNCDELREQYELYVLGVLEGPERTEIEEHLHREGDPCIAGVRRARQTMGSLAIVAPESHPPARLRKKIVGLVAEEKRGWNWMAVWIAASACLALTAVWLGVARREQQRELAQVQLEMQGRSAELARLNEAFAMMNDPAARQVTFGEGAPKPSRGRVVVSPGKGVLLMASNLPTAPRGKIYEMWIIPKGGKPVPAGLFQSASDGTAIHMRQGAVDLATTGVVAVTLEPEAGSAQPTTTPIIAAAL